MCGRVLVTGGAGYIGCVLSSRLLEKGYHVRVFDKLCYGRRGLENILDRIELIEGDVREFDSGVLDGVDSVIHLATYSPEPSEPSRGDPNTDVNTRGTLNVASACNQKNVMRFIMASSCAVYGGLHQPDSLSTEEDAVNPLGSYSKSKHAAENSLMQLTGGGFCPVILRVGSVYGVSPKMRYDLMVNGFVKDAFESGELTLYGRGGDYHPLVDVRDAADAFMACLEAPEKIVCGEVFNIVHENLSALKLAETIKEELEPKKDIKINFKESDKPVKTLQMSGEKIRKTLGFTPEKNIKEPITEIWSMLESPDAIT